MQVRASPIRAAAAAASADVDVDVVVASVPGVAGAGGAGGAGAGAAGAADAIAIHRERFFRVMGAAAAAAAAWCVADDNSAVFSAFIGFGKGSAAGVLHRDLDRSVEDGMIV